MASYRNTLFLCAGLLSAPAMASEPFPSCFFSFAALSADEAPIDLIVRTYRELFATLGGQKIEAASLKGITDPFVLPDDGVEIGMLNKKLEQLRELLRGKKWLTAEVNTRLLAGLRELAETQANLHEKRAEKMADTEGGFIVESPPTGAFISMHPGGRYVLVPKSAYVGPNTYPLPSSEVSVYDLKTRTLSTQTTTIGQLHAARFFPNGEAAAFGERGNSIQVVPFRDGKFAFEEAVLIGEKKEREHEQVENVQISGDGKVVYGSRLRDNLYRFDPAAKAKVEIKLRDYLGRKGASLEDWGVVPGTNRLYLLVHQRPTQAEMHEVTVDDAGIVTLVRNAVKWTDTVNPTARIPQRARVSADGRFAVTSDYRRVWVSDLKNGGTKEVALNHQLDQSYDTITTVTVHPTRHEAVVAIQLQDPNVFENKTYLVEVIDLDTGKTTHRLSKLSKDTRHLTFTNDGKWLFATDQYGIANRALNYRMKTETP